MIVYKSRRFAMRRYRYGGSGIVDTIGLLVARYVTNAVLATATKTAIRGTLDAAKRAVSHLIAHKVASTIAAPAKKREKVPYSPAYRRPVFSFFKCKYWVDKPYYPYITMRS